jgi:hypothetical protein
MASVLPRCFTLSYNNVLFYANSSGSQTRHARIFHVFINSFQLALSQYRLGPYRVVEMQYLTDLLQWNVKPAE